MAVHLAAARAAHPFIEVRQLTMRLPSGRMLLDDVSHIFAPGLTGVVGANGAGKSMFLRCIAGEIAPDAGGIARAARLHYVSQQREVTQGTTLAHLAGLGPLLAATRRMEAGLASSDDFDLLDGRWTALSDFAAALQQCGLGGHQPGEPTEPGDSAAGLSGGELTRVALAGAFHSGADWLLLDEPSNHLDRAGRAWLLDSLRTWPGSAIVVSHDRELLEQMDAIVELGASTLHAYGGNYTLYDRQRKAGSAAAATALAHARMERRNALRQQRERHDELQSRAARQNRAGKDANMPAILRGNLKSSAQAYAGRESVRRAETRAALDNAVRTAAERAADVPPVALPMPGAALPAARRVLAFEAAVAPWQPASRLASPLDLVLAGPVRLAITGPNGCGKTTLLRMLAGEIPPAAGSAKALIPFAWIDQHASTLDPEQSVLQALREQNSPLAEGVLRSHLALLGLSAGQVSTKTGRLSGGEKLKAVLACALWRKDPAQLLLLDEPSNHLDLQSTEALEQALAAYSGAMAIVSHDQRFLKALQPSHELRWTTDGWRLEEG